MIQDVLADIFLAFNKPWVVMPLLGIGYWAYRRDLFSDVLFLVLLSMIVNAFLKCLFQVPLKPHLNQHGWYAFPSGHMQLSTVLYGRLWWEFQKTKWAQAFLVLLMGMGWGMIWKNYHDLMDVAAGGLAGIGLLMSYSAFSRLSFVRRQPEKIGFFLLPLTAPLIFFMPSSIPPHLAHVWKAQGGILGFSLGMLVFKNTPVPPFGKQTMLIVVLGMGGLVAISFVSKALFGRLPYPCFPFFEFFMYGLWMATGPEGICKYIFKERRG
jgi:undecaprenyl-diphosphatase